jgi:hypothetical protein
MALLEQPDATLHDVLRMLSDQDFHKGVARDLRNETVRTFLLKEFDRFSFGYRADGTAPIQNKVGAFLADPLLNRILTAPKIDLHIRRIMDEGKVLLVNLEKGQIGEDSSSLLGGLLVTTIGLAAYSRADIPAANRRNFFVYIDEFQSFTTLALANMLSELRKHRVGFTVAHQYLHQLEPDVRHAGLRRQYALPVVAMGELEPIKKHALPTYTGEWAFPAALLAVPTRVCMASGTMGQGSASLQRLNPRKRRQNP